MPSARQARPGIRLVKTNQYRNPIRRQISGYGAPVSAPSGYGSPVSAPNSYGSPVAEVIEAKCKFCWRWTLTVRGAVQL